MIYKNRIDTSVVRNIISLAGLTTIYTSY